MKFSSFIVVGLAATVAGEHLYDPSAFPDGPPLASITGGSTISGPTGLAYSAPTVINAVSDQIIGIAGPVGITASSSDHPKT